jgi:thioredoxin 1
VVVPVLLTIVVLVILTSKPDRETAPEVAVPAPATATALAAVVPTTTTLPAQPPADPASTAGAHQARRLAVPPGGSIPRLVDLGADRCIPCKAMAPILVELRSEYAGRLQVDFIDVWKNPDAGDPYNIYAIPTQIFFGADGKELTRHQGFISKTDILATWKRFGYDFTDSGLPAQRN